MSEASDNVTPLSGTLPWTRSCFVCGENNPHGLKLRSCVKDGRVSLEYTTRDADRGYREIVHGGIAITLLDEVMTWASILAARSMCVAAELNVRLRKPIRVGQKLRVDGWITRKSARLIMTESQVLDEDGKVLLSAAGKYMPMPEGDVTLSERDFVVSPESIHPKDIVG